MAVLHIVPKFNAPGPSEFQASFWMDVQPTPQQADVAEITSNVTDWLQDIYDQIASRVQSTITAIEYVIYIHDLVTGQDSQYTTGNWTFAGSTSTKTQAPQLSPTLSAVVLTRDRPAQKRLLPLNDTTSDDGVLDAATQAALLVLGGQWVGARTPSTNFTYEPGLVSVGAPGEFNPFTGVLNVNASLGTLRSRKRGQGI